MESPWQEGITQIRVDKDFFSLSAKKKNFIKISLSLSKTKKANGIDGANSIFFCKQMNKNLKQKLVNPIKSELLKVSKNSLE